MIYGIYPAADTPPESLVAFNPQPNTVGLLYMRRQYAASGDVIDENPYWVYRWDALTEEEYQAILTQSGLASDKTAVVSANGPDDNYEEIIRNGIAVQPQIGSDGQRDNMFLRNFALIVKQLRAQA